jgi:hypothetical protein
MTMATWLVILPYVIGPVSHKAIYVLFVIILTTT